MPAQLTGLTYHVGDASALLLGKGLEQVKQLTIEQATFVPADNPDHLSDGLKLTLAKTPPPAVRLGDDLHGRIELQDGRILNITGTVLPARPIISILSRRVVDAPASSILLGSAPGTPTELPLGAQLLFFIKSAVPFPRTGSLELAGPDDTLHKTLTVKDGLILQDAHTLLATIDPLKLFGPSTFGLFRIRAVMPDPKPDGSAGDWLPLATVVRLPTPALPACRPVPLPDERGQRQPGLLFVDPGAGRLC